MFASLNILLHPVVVQKGIGRARNTDSVAVGRGFMRRGNPGQEPGPAAWILIPVRLRDVQRLFNASVNWRTLIPGLAEPRATRTNLCPDILGALSDKSVDGHHPGWCKTGYAALGGCPPASTAWAASVSRPGLNAPLGAQFPVVSFGGDTAGLRGNLGAPVHRGRDLEDCRQRVPVTLYLRRLKGRLRRAVVAGARTRCRWTVGEGLGGRPGGLRCPAGLR